MTQKEVSDTTIEEIKNNIAHGSNLRESGDYKQGLKELSQAFDQAIATANLALASEAVNQLSIQYRLIAGRSGRNGDLVESEQFSSKSLDVYKKLETFGLLDAQDHVVTRNRSHALLYAGYIDEAVTALQYSAEVQTNLGVVGDETCHLASAYLALGDIQKAKASIVSGLQLVEDNDGSAIALTYGLMTQASIFSATNHPNEATASLKHALQIAEANNLAVRKEEIQFLLNQPSNQINVLEAVAGDLKLIRDLEREISQNWKIPEKLSEKPIVLGIGGFQGSGKSSILERLSGELGLIIISGDKIRKILFDRGVIFSDKFVQIVDATSAALFRRAMRLGYSVASDANITPAKIELFKSFISEEGFTNYSLVTTYINVSEDELRRRVQNRPSLPDRYTGKVNELNASIKKHGQIDQSVYDIVLNGEQLSLEQEVNLIKEMIIDIK